MLRSRKSSSTGATVTLGSWSTRRPGGLIGQVGEPRVPGTRDEQGLDLSAGRAKRADEALGLVVVDDGVLLTVDDEVGNSRWHALGLDSLKRREPL